MLLNLIAAVVIIGSQFFNARLWLDCYPESIRNAVKSQTKKEKRNKLIPGLPFLVSLFLFPYLAGSDVYHIMPGVNYVFLKVFFAAFGVGFIFNLYDLLILDWLIFCYITPKYQIIKGSEHLLKEYKNYKFHFISFLKGLLYAVIYSLTVAFFVVYILN